MKTGIFIALLWIGVVVAGQWSVTLAVALAIPTMLITAVIVEKKSASS